MKRRSRLFGRKAADVVAFNELVKSFNMEFTSDELAGRSNRTAEVSTEPSAEVRNDTEKTDKPDTSVQ